MSESNLERIKNIQEEIDKYRRLSKKAAKFRIECLGLANPSAIEKSYDDKIIQLSQQLDLIKNQLQDLQKYDTNSQKE